MKQIKKLIVLCVLVVTVLIGFLLPPVISKIQDSQINGKLESVEGNIVQLKMVSDLTLIERFLVVDRAGTSFVYLQSGQDMEYEDAVQCLDEELEKLFADINEDTFLDKYSKIVSIHDYSEVEHQIILFSSGDESVILWDFYLENDNQDSIRVLLDDNSGAILSFQYNLYEETSSSDFFERIEDNGGTCEAYLELLMECYTRYLVEADMKIDADELADFDFMYEGPLEIQDGETDGSTASGDISDSSDGLIDDSGAPVAESNGFVVYLYLTGENEEYELELKLTRIGFLMNEIDF